MGVKRGWRQVAILVVLLDLWIIYISKRVDYGYIECWR